MELKFKWKPGDIASKKIGQSRYEYFVILGTTKFDPNKQRYPNYIAKRFGSYKNRKFFGYHTKSFHSQKRKEIYTEQWFEGMQYLWEVSKLDPSKLSDLQRKAYEAAIEDAEINYANYYHSQIMFIFEESK